MKKILGIIASPRKLGNCEVIVKEISRNVPEEHELKLLRLQDFDIKACTGCYRCLYGGKCVLDDDLGTLLEAMCGADAYIVAAPAYFLGANSSLKSLMDRGLSFYGVKERLWGKPSIAVAAAGIEGKEGSTLLTIQSFLKCLLSDIKTSAVFSAALPGEIFFDENVLGGNVDRAQPASFKDLGAALFGAALERGDPCCPLCGGDSFRFLGGGKLRCMLCGNEGTLVLRGEEPARDGAPAPESMPAIEMVLDIKKGGHDFFLDREAALRHEDWLRGMKDRFIAELPKIKAVRERYKGGDWVKPRPKDRQD